MKLIPFNLDRCIAGDGVVTRGGEDYVFGAYNEKMHFPLIGWIGISTVSHTASGRSYANDKSPSRFDLFMKPKKITRWIYVNRDSGYDSKESAVEFRVASFMSLIKVEFYEGEGFE